MLRRPLYPGAFLACAVLVLGLTGCSGDGLPSFESVCEDPVGDTPEPDGSDVTEVSLRSDGRTFTVTFVFAEDVDPTRLPNSSFQVIIVDRYGDGGYRLGTSFVGGALSIIYAFDNMRAEQLTYEDYVFENGSLAVTLPAEDFIGLEKGMRWFATSAAAEEIGDYCGSPDDMNVVSF